MGRNKYVDLFKDMIPAVDKGIKELWDAAGEDGQKEIKGDFWNLNRYISCVRSSDRETQELAIFKTNEYYNKNYTIIAKNHPKLLWYSLCLCKTNSKRTLDREWIKLNYSGSRTSDNKLIAFLNDKFPEMKSEDVELLAHLNSKSDIKEFARDLGLDDTVIKTIL